MKGEGDAMDSVFPWKEMNKKTSRKKKRKSKKS